MRAAILCAVLITGCAHAIRLDRDLVLKTTGCYQIDFGDWRINRDGVAIAAGPRTFQLQLSRESVPRDTGSAEHYKVRQLSGPPFGPEVPPGPFRWNVVRRPSAGFNVSNFNGLYGLYFNVAQTDSGLMGPATIATDYNVPGSDGVVSGTIGTAVVRATRVKCEK